MRPLFTSGFHNNPKNILDPPTLICAVQLFILLQLLPESCSFFLFHDVKCYQLKAQLGLQKYLSLITKEWCTQLSKWYRNFVLVPNSFMAETSLHFCYMHCPSVYIGFCPFPPGSCILSSKLTLSPQLFSYPISRKSVTHC